MAISVYTVWLGVAMLLSLTTAEDVLLNCLALNFILDIDEIVFRSFAPIGVQKTLEEIDFEFYDQARVWSWLQTLRSWRVWVLSPIIVPLTVSVGLCYFVFTTNCTYSETAKMYVSRNNGEEW